MSLMYRFFMRVYLVAVGATFIIVPGGMRQRAFAEENPAKAEAERTTAPAATPSPEARIGALEQEIRTLEARIHELEARKAETENAAGNPSPSNAAAAAANPSPAPAPAEAAPTGSATPAPAAAPAGNHTSFFDKLTFSGFVDTYYNYNFNRPPSGMNGLRNFDERHNSLSLSLLDFSIDRAPDPLGFHVDFDYGDTAKFVHAAEPGGADVFQYLQQAYIDYKAPIGKGLTLSFGKFVTQHGAEVINVKDDWNYSRSLLFAWAIPYYHFGLRAQYTFNDKVGMTGYVVNGWNNVVDNNTAKTYGFQLALNPTKSLSIVQNYMAGPEQTSDNNDWRHLFDTTVTYNITPKLAVMSNYDYGMDRVMGTGARAFWQGVAGYFRAQVTPWFAFGPRVEWFEDPQGFTTGTAQKAKEATLTTEFKVHESLVLRPEWRYDWSDQAVFDKHGPTTSKNQSTIGVGIFYILGQEH